MNGADADDVETVHIAMSVDGGRQRDHPRTMHKRMKGQGAGEHGTGDQPNEH